MESKPLPRFVECEYSVFVSYAADDNTTYGNWAQDFAQVLHSQIDAALGPHQRSIGRDPLPAPHAFELDGIAGGALSTELKRRIAKSFAMVVVIGESYVASTWCMAELRYFHECFGDEGVAKRLSIVELGKKPMDSMRKRVDWQAIVPADQASMQFYGKEIGASVVGVQRPDGKAPSTEFLKRFSPLRARLIDSVITDIDKPVEVPDVQVLIGVCVEELNSVVDAFAETVRGRGLSVARLDIRQDIDAWIKRAQCLVLPFNRAQPLSFFGPGGHLAHQTALWKKFQKSDDSVHALDLSHISGPAIGAPQHLAYIDSWCVHKLTQQALLNKLFPPPVQAGANTALRGRPRARVLIESNTYEVLQWSLLKQELEPRWEKVLKDKKLTTLDFPLFTNGLEVDDLDQVALDDADGLIVLWGKREKRTLSSHINKVEDNLQSPAPGIVAYLCPPNPHADSAVPAVQWEVLRFSQRPEDPPPPTVVEPDPDDEDRLSVFLQGVFKRAQRRFRPSDTSPLQPLAA